MNIIKRTEESFDFTDDNGKPCPALVTRGCGCCSSSLPVTRENIDKAIAQTREWLAELESMQPVSYPAEINLTV
jgi:hypothetical protein